jgi:nucleoside-triphosphatase THEP1
MRPFVVKPNFAEISAWVYQLISFRLNNQELLYTDFLNQFPLPEVTTESKLGNFIHEQKLSTEAQAVLFMLLEFELTQERLVDLLFKPNVFSLRLEGNLLIPTVYTLARLIHGTHIQNYRPTFDLFANHHPFNTHSIIEVGDPPAGLSEHAGYVKLVSGVFNNFSKNYFTPPKFGSNFPAKFISTVGMDIDDLLVPPYFKKNLLRIMRYPGYERLMRDEMNMGKQMPQGYRILLSGKPGTGKSMTAAIIAEHMDRDLYRVDISQVTSKYIGETEKRLSALFDMAEGKNWILFFDEADAIFGSRTRENRNKDGGNEVAAGHRNDMVSYLLQRIEDYNGVIICATNLDENIDPALKRRFQEHLKFPEPNREITLDLWDKYLPKNFPLSKNISADFLVRAGLPPAMIRNVCNRATVHALDDDAQVISLELLDLLIKNERMAIGLPAVV